MLLPAAGESLAVIATIHKPFRKISPPTHRRRRPHRHIRADRVHAPQFELTIRAIRAQRAGTGQPHHVLYSEYQRRYGQGALVSGAPVELSACGRSDAETVRAELVHSSPNPAAKTNETQRQIWVGDGFAGSTYECGCPLFGRSAPGEVSRGRITGWCGYDDLGIRPRVTARLSEHRTIDWR